MRDKIADESIDLIYLDPPFNSKKNYNLIYKTATGLPVPEQAEAFCDSWEMDDEKWELVQNMRVTMRHYEMEASFIEFWYFWIAALKNSNRKLLAPGLHDRPAVRDETLAKAHWQSLPALRPYCQLPHKNYLRRHFRA